MFVHDIVADFGETVPFVLERVLSDFEVLLEAGSGYFGVTLKGGLKV